MLRRAHIAQAKLEKKNMQHRAVERQNRSRFVKHVIHSIGCVVPRLMWAVCTGGSGP